MNSWHQTIKQGGEKLLDIFLPPRCVVSGEMVDHQGMIAPKVWSRLNFISNPLCKTCGLPFSFEMDEGSQCTDCLLYPPPYEEARAALHYNDASKDLILGFKHGDKTHAVQTFLPWLLRTGAQYFEAADMLIPVPLHRWRLIRRQYNQAAVIANALAKETGLPAMNLALMRTRHTPVQGHLNFKDRRKNVKKAFAVNEKHTGDLKGKTVILIDDVYTTGSTVKECTKVLKKAGVERVFVLAVARAYKEV